MLGARVYSLIDNKGFYNDIILCIEKRLFI